MIIIRPIQRKDQDIFAEFSFESILGMTNLPRDRDQLLEKIAHSEASFSQDIKEPGDEEYYFVLEDLTTGRIGGTCGILAQSAQSFRYCYRIETLRTHAKDSSTPKEMKILKVVSNSLHASEVCALYLQPTFRHSGQGRLLSLSRFLFIAAQRHRFRKKIVAEMRGYIDQRQISPFWEGIGRHFCDLSFVELMAQMNINHAFVPEILPQFPIYISLLPKETQEAIGKVHDNTQPAYQMLLRENFSFHHEIDIFEGGPILSATTSEIRSIKNSCLVHIDVTKEPLMDGKEYILANESTHFRACFGKMQMVSKTKAILHEEVANALLVKKGDQIRYVTLH